ncbi:FAD-dependent oxidoreductase [Granulicella tundricola]|uniref:Response regulator receiver modulated FAD-dependent pyridine nucleotide-disulfide oxidoreductase n=1 Tax=Granulicella tundricola (strain ATCC BAA-1859 / DSM 23138 / MP5ACTX9) TaxID=1198114 RepID=E8X4C3_GRATM|nr:FAD-dependent oxidoreductase [Granulicella tundricola]ADW68250.1 response regulator receiver modulated FAD-dependent pyridine nucleotide-disulfide oxidoreductase [Granulicella tundricola MP5ACTX9]
MAKPVLLAIDDDVSVLEAVVQDLRRKYGQTYRIVRAASGGAALDISKQLKERGDVVALFLSDQRMPGMTGVDLLQAVIELYPDAKRVLLTAYADTEAAIRAINSARIHYYLNKPWDPPEEKLYPVLDDLLQAWNQGHKPAYDGIQLVSARWGVGDHEVRNFLSRNRIQFKWLNPDLNPEAMSTLRDRGLDEGKLPVVLFGDGSSLVQPTTTEIAQKVGLRTQAQQEYYDVVVVGAGPAGLAAGVYGASEGLKTLLVEPMAPGGQAGSSSKIENYLGFPEGVSGDELAKRAYIQAQRLGAEFLTQGVTNICSDNGYHILRMTDGREVTCRVCLIATGVDYCWLCVPGEERLRGKGVFYGAALTETNTCANEEVHIVGGANSAGQAAMHFSKHATKVRMLVRGPSLTQSMSKYLIDQIAATPNIVVETGTEVIGVEGDGNLERVKLMTPEGEVTRDCVSLFIFIGAAPKTDWLPKAVALDNKGFILAGPDLKTKSKEDSVWKLERDPYLLETSLPGVFVAGDVRHGSVKRCASAVGEGSIAIQFVHQYLATL